MFRKLALFALVTFLAALIGCHHNHHLHTVYAENVLQSNSLSIGDSLSFCGSYDVVYMGNNQIHVNLVGAKTTNVPTIRNRGRHFLGWEEWYSNSPASDAAEVGITYYTGPRLGLIAKLDGCGTLMTNLKSGQYLDIQITADTENCTYSLAEMQILPKFYCSFICNGEENVVLQGTERRIPFSADAECVQRYGEGSVNSDKSAGVMFFACQNGVLKP